MNKSNKYIRIYNQSVLISLALTCLCVVDDLEVCKQAEHRKDPNIPLIPIRTSHLWPSDTRKITLGTILSPDHFRVHNPEARC